MKIRTPFFAMALVASALLFAGFTTAPAMAQQAAAATSAHTNFKIGIITENVDKPLPTQITVSDGTVIAFMREPMVGSNVDVKAAGAKGTAQLVPVAMADTLPGYHVVKAFKVVGKGTVVIDVYHTYVIPGAQPKLTSSMSVTVQ
jgi:hypothetical protein